MAAYSGTAPLMAFDPSIPFHIAEGSSNPAFVHFPGEDAGWRPQALVEGPGGKVYIGAVAGYGRLGGPLSVWDVEGGAVQQYHHVVRDQSVVSLALWKDRIVGGTTVRGGGGSHPTQAEARLFVWNPATHQKEFELPVSGEESITDLIAAPNHLVYGIAGSSLLVFDPQTRRLADRKRVPFKSAVYNSVAIGPEGKIWGIAADGIFCIDTRTNTAVLVARAPQKITGGFALRGRALFFISGPGVYRYLISE